MTSAAEKLNTVSAPRFHTRIIPSQSAKMIASGVCSTMVLFRDLSWRPGLVYPNCAHRGTSLYYGKVDERGIRCCYYGGLFDAQGQCLEQPCEPQGGLARDRVRQPWYPVQERYGLIWAYLGPPERKSVPPRYECLEQLDEGEFLEAAEAASAAAGRRSCPATGCSTTRTWSTPSTW